MASSAKRLIGNSKPRIFPTAPETTTTTKKRATANTGAKRGPKKATTTKASKPAGVTKKKAPAKKTSVATKVRRIERALSRRSDNTLFRLRALLRRLKVPLLETQKRRYVGNQLCCDNLLTRSTPLLTPKYWSSSYYSLGQLMMHSRTRRKFLCSLTLLILDFANP